MGDRSWCGSRSRRIRNSAMGTQGHDLDSWKGMAYNPYPCGGGRRRLRVLEREHRKDNTRCAVSVWYASARRKELPRVSVYQRDGLRLYLDRLSRRQVSGGCLNPYMQTMLKWLCNRHPQQDQCNDMRSLHKRQIQPQIDSRMC